MVKLPNCRATQSSISATSCSQIDAHDPAQFELQRHMTYIQIQAREGMPARTDGHSRPRAVQPTKEPIMHIHTYTLSACAPHIDLNLAASLDGNCIGMDGFGRGAEPIGGALQ
jgi:hypothetical protein